MSSFIPLLSWIYCLLAVAENENFNTRLRIIGGEEAVPHAYPYQVLLKFNNKRCGGSLISAHYVLTAAHCTTQIRNNHVTVTLGAHNITSDETTQVHIMGSEVFTHESYDPKSYRNDIALIRLASPAPLNDVIGTIALPSRGDFAGDYLKVEATSTGWGLSEGKTNPTPEDTPNILRVVNVTVSDLKTCKEIYKNENSVNYVTENNLCTSDSGDNKGTCYGDSGGPLVYLGKQIGIVSHGSEDCDENAPSVFTRVDKFLNWIEQHSDVVDSQNIEPVSAQFVSRDGNNAHSEKTFGFHFSFFIKWEF